VEIVQIAQDPTKAAITWGGKRRGAGRPARHAIASEPHRIRTTLTGYTCFRVTVRATRAIAELGAQRTQRLLERVRTAALRAEFRVVGVAARKHTVELVVEASDRHVLARGMQGFEVRAARALNRAGKRSGCVFADRYRAVPLATIDARRAALAALSRRTPHPHAPHDRLATGYSSSRPGVNDSAPPPLRSASSGIRYSSPSQRPRSTS
jgi:hypothetical protein